jgi:hypothetical protein
LLLIIIIVLDIISFFANIPIKARKKETSQKNFESYCPQSLYVSSKRNLLQQTAISADQKGDFKESFVSLQSIYNNTKKWNINH